MKSQINSKEKSNHTEVAKRHIAHFRVEIQEVIAVRSFLMVAEKTCITDYADGMRTHFHVLIGKALLERILILLDRLFDDFKPERNRHNERYCLKRLFYFLEDEEVRKRITVRGGEGEMANAIQAWEDLNNAWEAKLKNVRDRVSAHNLLDLRSGLDPITYDELWQFTDKVERLVENLACSSGVTSVSLSAERCIWDKRAEEYWHHFVV